MIIIPLETLINFLEGIIILGTIFIIGLILLINLENNRRMK
jgi:hypothetical protein